MKQIQRFVLRVWGDFALFTRPENKVERFSYDVITPSAARGIFDAIYWKPQIVWRIDRLHVIKPIRFTSLRRNEVKSKVSATSARKAMTAGKGCLGFYVDDGDNRQQRAATLLRDVDYVIEAHFDLLSNHEPAEKHSEIFRRRTEKGQYHHTPYLGCREFAADFELLNGNIPGSQLAGIPAGSRDLGLMLHDIDFANGKVPRFFSAVMRDGVIDVPPWEPMA